MLVDLTKLILDSDYNSFKNNYIYTGTITISGTTSPGANVITHTVTLTSVPDMIDIVFGGPSWFKQGVITVLGTDIPNGYNNYPTNWVITSSINGVTLTITYTFIQQFIANLALTPVNFGYRLIDYSVF